MQSVPLGFCRLVDSFRVPVFALFSLQFCTFVALVLVVNALGGFFLKACLF